MDVQELKDRARALVVKGRLEKAEVLYRQVVTLVPGDAPAWIRHAETLRRLGRLGEAVWSYRTAANILRSLGHDGRALASLKIALELKPDDIDLIAEIIRVEMHRKRRLERSSFLVALESSGSGRSMQELDRPKLALPMLTESDPRPSAESGLLAPEAAVPAPPLDHRPAMEPAPGGSAQLDLEVQVRPAPVWPQVRRIHDTEVAIKAGPDARWIVVSSTSPLDIRFEASLAIDEHTPWLE